MRLYSAVIPVAVAWLACVVAPAQARQCIEWQQIPTQVSPPEHGMDLVYDKARHEVLALGGFTTSNRVEVYRLNGSSWTQASVPGPAPGPRLGFGVCYHEARQSVVLFGGYWFSQTLTDMWEWDGAAWTQIVHPGPWPSEAGADHLTYDPSRNRIILLKQQAGSSHHWRTWEWTGTAWETGVVFDSIGTVEQMCFDAKRSRGFVYAVDGDNEFVLEYTPAPTGAQGVWNQIPVLGIPLASQSNVSIKYDPFRRQIVRFGGRRLAGLTYFYDPHTWAWDPVGTQWISLTTEMPGGVERIAGGMCFDWDRGQMVLYGGGNGSPGSYGYFFDTWELQRESPGIIVDPPPAALWCPGGSHVLSITRAGEANVRWYRNGQVIPGATSTILLVNPVTAAHAGTYVAEVWNNCGNTFSTPCVVTVPPTAVIQQPFFYYPSACPGGVLGFVQPQPPANTLGTLVLQKKFGEFWETIPVPYSPSEQAFIIQNAQNSDTGWYRLAVTSVCGTVVSGEVHVQVGVTFDAHPQSLSLAACQGAQFSVDAAGVGPLTYQWHKDGQPITDGGHISGATTDTLSIAGARYDDEGSYHCVVSDTCETRQTTAAAIAIPAPPPWTHRTTSGPPYRSVQASDIAYDPVRGVCVLYGGYGANGYLDDTWEWDGIEWVRKFPPTNPGKRSGQELVFDPGRGAILLFGGSGLAPANSEVWSYDGDDWTLVTASPGGPPVNEASHGDVAFDAARGKLVLICEGPPSFPIPRNATWEFDSAAATWQLVAEDFGPSHAHSPIVFDPELEVTLGQFYWPTMAATEARTWAQAGGPWTDLGVPTPARYWPVMAYDGLRRRSTAYGCCRNLGPGAYTTDTHAFGAGGWSQVLPDFHTTQGNAVVPLAMAYDSRRRAMVMVGSTYDDYWAGVPLQTWEYRYLDKVVIDRQPQDQPLIVGQNAAFSVHAAGAGALSYQWLKGSTPLLNGATPGGSVVSGATAATLSITGVTPGDAGVYVCVIWNNCGQRLTEPAHLGTVCYPDCNGSGTVTVADFGCFQTKFVTGDLYADCNQSGTLTVSDFGCFQSAYVAGCP